MTRILFFALAFTTIIHFTASAQNAAITPATHMWVRTGINSVVFVPVRSAEECVMLIQQAADINSSEGNCYNGANLVRAIECQKSTKRGERANCTTR